MLALALFLLIVPVLSIAHADDSMYKCADGTFTNRADRLCPAYDPQGTVMIRPTDVTFSSMRSILDEFHAPPMPMGHAVPPAQSVTSETCALYQEWQDLNLRSGGGVTLGPTQNIPRWLALSRIFTAIGAPHCP